MRAAIYCVSKNGYETCLKIRNNVYKNLHIYVSQRVANMLNLESENIENLFVINERVPILLEKIFKFSVSNHPAKHLVPYRRHAFLPT